MPASERSTAQATPVAVAMCTYQGEQFVEAQLRSLQRQSYPVCLHIVDDASNDNTASRVRALSRPGLDTFFVQSVNVGYVKNFETSIQAALDSGAQYIALSDQDDVWHVDRIESGMQLMHELECTHGENAPLLVHSDLRLIDGAGAQTSPSFLARRRYRITTEKNLLLVLGENGVMGNTILMNRVLAELCLPFPAELHVHDYWIALLAELFGQRAMLDTATVDYRLHSHNASNTAESMCVKRTWPFKGLTRKKLLGRNFKLPFKEDSRITALMHLLEHEASYPSLDNEQRATVLAFVDYLIFEQSRWRSLSYLLRSGAVRSGLGYRLRLCLVTLLTQRYCKRRMSIR